MSMIINAPTDQVTTYDVAGQSDVQLNFDFDPTLFRTDGTTLIIEYEGHEIRLENFFNADGTSGVENFLTQDGQAFAAADLLAAVMGGEPGTAEEIETAAGNAGGGSGAGEYSDDPGNLLDGLDAVGDQPDAYAHEPMTFLEGDDFDVEAGGETHHDYVPGNIWYRFGNDEYSYFNKYKPQSGEVAPKVDGVPMEPLLRTRTEYHGDDGYDVLTLPEYAVGAGLLLEDDSINEAGTYKEIGDWDTSGHPADVDPTARISGIEEIQGSSHDDVIDLSGVHEYTDSHGVAMGVTIYGNGGDDMLWTNTGDDVIYGGTGDDTMIGGLGDDSMYGGADNDVLWGSNGNDLLNGDDGNDDLWGGTGNDTIYGGSGADEIHGGADNDVIFGGAGNDVIDAGGGDDSVHAGTGAHDYVTLGAGHDTLVIDADSLGASSAQAFDPNGATVEVVDFSTDDTIDFSGLTGLSGLHVDAIKTDDVAGNPAVADYQIHVTAGGQDAWIVLTDAADGGALQNYIDTLLAGMP